jgi:HAD superfamily phosphoserine phosphatase-like hydrolase
MSAPRPIAIFDIDGTIFRSSLNIQLFERLVREGIFQSAVLRRVRKSEEKWLNRQGHYDDYVHELVRAYQKAIVGKDRRDIVRVSKRVVAEQKYRTYRYTRHLLEKVRRKYFTICISSSPLEVVQEYNKFLKFDKIYGWELGVNERGRYTGVTLHLPALYKKELIVRYVQGHHLSLKGSLGVGDTETDIGFLELVEEPIAFNPNVILARYARQHDWRIVIERKDLIVELDPRKVKFLKV